MLSSARQMKHHATRTQTQPLARLFSMLLVVLSFGLPTGFAHAAGLYAFQKAFSCPLILEQFKLYQDHLRVMEAQYHQTEATTSHLEQLQSSHAFQNLSWLKKREIRKRISRFDQLLHEPTALQQGDYAAAVTIQGQDLVVDYLQSLAKKIDSEMTTARATGLSTGPNLKYAAAGLAFTAVGLTFFNHHLAQVIGGDPSHIKKSAVSLFMAAMGNSLFTSEIRKTDRALENFMNDVTVDLLDQSRASGIETFSQTYKILPSTWRGAFGNQGIWNRSSNFAKDQNAMYYGQPFNTETITRHASMINPEEKPLYVTIDLIYERSALVDGETNLSILVHSSARPNVQLKN